MEKTVWIVVGDYMKQFSKRLLRLDYIISIVLICCFIVFCLLNGIFQFQIDISTFSVVLCAWIAQLGISSTAYYVLIKSEHKIELPMMLINELPDDIKEKVDMTTIVTTVLTSTEN